jgi:hypothetical protein
MSFTRVAFEKALLLIRVTCVAQKSLVGQGLYNTRDILAPTPPPAGFEPEIPRSDRPQTYTLSRATAGFGT